METTNVFERVDHTPWMALSVIDLLAKALGRDGAFPPPLGDIRCVLVARTTPAARVFEPPRVLSAFRNRSGYLVLDGTWYDPADPARTYPLGAGTYDVRVGGTLYQDAGFSLTWPPAAGTRRIPVPQPGNANDVGLLPSAAYPFPDVTIGRLQLGPTIVRGAAFAADGTPLPDLPAEIVGLPPPGMPALNDWPFLSTRSGPGGDWALVLPGRRYIDDAPDIPPALPLVKRLDVRIGYPAGPVTVTQDVLLGSEHAVPNTALRGQVLGPGGRPLAGVPITTSAGPAASVTRADGSWTLYFGLNQAEVARIRVTAAPPGRPARTDDTATLRPRATVVVPTFHFS
jgi:hypothetical protein